MPLDDAKKTAARLGISTWQLYSLAARGLIPSVKLGRSVRFDPETISKWIAEGGNRKEDAHHE
jgi:excisionase family DNA binding protein